MKPRTKFLLAVPVALWISLTLWSLYKDNAPTDHEYHKQCPYPDDPDFYDCDWWPPKEKAPVAEGFSS